MLISILEKINGLYENIFSPLDGLIEKLPFSDWIIDAFIDSFHLLPFLFLIFILIEFIEYYYAGKINLMLKKTGKFSIIAGSLAAIFPQCGFSVIAASLYSRQLITRGCLIAVFLSTSDETIPILLATPSKAYLIIPIVSIKLLAGILTGYLVDFLCPKILNENISEREITEEGCCKHDIEHGNKRELIIHPILHTMNVFGFILIITLILNYVLTHIQFTDYIYGSGFFEVTLSTLAGLIPNCAISIGLTMMLIKGTLSFGAVMGGLLANAGLGLLVLLKNNDFKDTIKIIGILILVSIVTGILINLLI